MTWKDELAPEELSQMEQAPIGSLLWKLKNILERRSQDSEQTIVYKFNNRPELMTIGSIKRMEE